MLAQEGLRCGKSFALPCVGACVDLALLSAQAAGFSRGLKEGFVGAEGYPSDAKAHGVAVPFGIYLGRDVLAIAELGAIFKEAMKLLSPFMPFISEYLWHSLSGTSLENADSIMIAKYPRDIVRDEKIEQIFALVIEAVVSIRRAKATIELGNAKIAKAYVKCGVDLSGAREFIRTLAKCDEIEFAHEIVANSARDVSENLESFVPLAGVDTSAIVARLNSQKTKLENMLANEKFIASAPANIIETNRAGLATAKEKMAKIVAELANLGA